MFQAPPGQCAGAAEPLVGEAAARLTAGAQTSQASTFECCWRGICMCISIQNAVQQPCLPAAGPSQPSSMPFWCASASCWSRSYRSCWTLPVTWPRSRRNSRSCCGSGALGYETSTGSGVPNAGCLLRRCWQVGLLPIASHLPSKDQQCRALSTEVKAVACWPCVRAHSFSPAMFADAMPCCCVRGGWVTCCRHQVQLQPLAAGQRYASHAPALHRRPPHPFSSCHL